MTSFAPDVFVPSSPDVASETATPAASVVLPGPGDVVSGKYRIERVVGEGGMGVVYAAQHLLLDQRVALKVLLVDPIQGAEGAERFVREAQAAARLHSEHLVRVVDAGTVETGAPFLVMEYLEGRDLAEVLRTDGPLRATDVADYILQALAALAKAHAAGIVHRDVKPANLFLSVRDDGSTILKVLDFGISKQRSRKPQWKELTGKTILGTPNYMSPEQLRSSKNVDARADIWSVGVVMYELLCGRPPFDGDEPGEIFSAILETTPESPQAHRPDLTAAWVDVIGKCLERSVDARFQSVMALAAALAPLGSQRWSHLLGEIEGTLAVAVQPLPDMALIEAADEAARSSMRPPRRSPVPDAILRFTRRVRTLAGGTDKTLSADIAAVHGEAPLRRPRIVAALVALAAVLLLALFSFGRHASTATGAQPHVAVAPTSEIVVAPSRSTVDPPAEVVTAAPSLSAVVLAPASAGPPEMPSAPLPLAPDEPLRSPKTPGTFRTLKAGSVPKAGSQPLARPKFLQSWK